jgi:hypothetical protein
MADHAETLKTMLQDIINGKQEQAAVTMHDYFVSKTREVTGMAPTESVETTDNSELDLGTQE